MADGRGMQAHPHSGGFLRGLMISLCIGAGLMLAFHLLMPDKTQEKKFEQYMNEAVDMFHAGSYQTAVKSFEKARKLAIEGGKKTTDEDLRDIFLKREADARYYLAATRIRLLQQKYAAEFEKAMLQKEYRFLPPQADLEPIQEEIRAGLVANPEHARLYHARGMLESVSGLYPRAIRAYEKAIELNPRFPEAYNDLGIAYLNIRQFDKAKDQFERALISSEPGQGELPDAHYNLGLFYASRSQKGGDTQQADRAKAVQHLKTFLTQEKSASPSRQMAQRHLQQLEAPAP